MGGLLDIILDPRSIAGTSDDLVAQELAARRAPVSSLPGDAAQPQQLTPGPAVVPPALNGDVLPPASRPMPRSLDLSTLTPPADDSNAMLRDMARILMLGGTSPAERIQGMQLLFKANQPNEEQLR